MTAEADRLAAHRGEERHERREPVDEAEAALRARLGAAMPPAELCAPPVTPETQLEAALRLLREWPRGARRAGRAHPRH